MLSNEHYEGYFGNPGDPGIADQLRIKRQQAIRILGISARGCLPVDDASLTVELANRIEVRNKLMPSREIANHFDLKVVLRCSNTNAIALYESLEQVNALVGQTVPRLAVLVIQRSISEETPFLVEGRARIFLSKQGCKSFLKATSEDHRSPSLLFPPSIEVAVPIATRATKVAAELGVAQNHVQLAFSPGTSEVQERASHSPAGAKPSRF